MAASNLNEYVQKVAVALDEREGVKCAELLSFSHSHIANARLRVEAPEAVCSRFMAQPFDEMVAAHIKVFARFYISNVGRPIKLDHYFKTIWASSKQQHDDAWQYQNMCVSAFIKGEFTF